MSSAVRERNEILALILQTCSDGCTKLVVMGRVFLTDQQAAELLPMLIREELLEYSGQTQKYRTTSKGVTWLGKLKAEKGV